MSSKRYILAIDQGTSSTKTLIIDADGLAIAKGSEPLHTFYLDSGFVEQDAEEIYQNVLLSVKKCLQQFGEKGFNATDIAAIGISNQRETFVIWDKNGRPMHAAIVWQCKRSVQICEELKEMGLSSKVNEKTGLIIDPYFSGTKLIWLFRNNEKVKDSIQKKEAYFGTIDTWLLYKFTNGKEYATDLTNASRTLMFNLHSLQWDEELTKEFGLVGIKLPRLKRSSSLFGETTLNDLLPKPTPITAMIGDSHAAAFGEGCFEKGTAKATLGTGCSILMNVGDRPILSNNGMVTTICWSTEDRVDYALEGVIVSCGATLEWLKDELKLFENSKETETMANLVADNGGVYLIPAFSGLGSPYWQMNRRASITGLSFSTTKDHVVRAALESIPYQIKDVIGAMEKDAITSLRKLNTNGGITSNKFLMQFLSDLLNIRVACSEMTDASALGAAFLAGLKARIFESFDQLTQLKKDGKAFLPSGSNKLALYYNEWKDRIYS